MSEATLNPAAELNFPTEATIDAWNSAVDPGETYTLLGNSIAHLLFDRDYSIILGRVGQSLMPGADENWQRMQRAIAKLLSLCDQLDSDGITLYTPNPATPELDFQCHENVTGQRLPQILAEHQELGAINLAQSLQMALAQYFRRKAEGRTQANGEIILAIFDGEPLNRQGIVRAIVDATRHMDCDEELGIGLLQVGDDPLAEGFLKSLDDDLQRVGANFDLVKTCKLETLSEDDLSEFLTQVITG